jgi:plastocyanin
MNVGDIFYDKDKNTLVIYDGVAKGGISLLRADLGNAETGLGVAVSSTPPANSRSGSLWFDIKSGELFIYVDDGDSEQWVQPSTPVFSVGGSSSSGTVIDPVDYILPTASTTVLGGVRIDGTTITINNGVISSATSSPNLFSTISVAQQNSIVAKSANSTLTLIAGANISLITDNINDTVTISSISGSGGGISLTDLSVVVSTASSGGSLTYNPNNGQFSFSPADLTWNNVADKPNFAVVATTGDFNDLINKPIVLENLQDLSNVTISNVSDGQVLKYNAGTGQWINASDLTGDGGSGIGLGDLSVTVTGASGSGNLTYNTNTGVFTFTPPNLTSFITLNSISATGDVSYNNSTGVISFNNSTGFITRTGISATGDVSYNNSTGVISFNNSTGFITRTGISVTQATASGNGSLTYNNSTGVFTFTPPDVSSSGGDVALDDLSDVSINNVNPGQILLFTGSSFVNYTQRSFHQFAYSAITSLDVTNSGASAYLFNNQYTGDNPTIYAINGTTIAFNLNVIGHPFLIQTAAGSNFNTGLIHVDINGTISTGTNAQGKTSGTLYWQVPVNISGNYRYICSIHASMVGTINIKNIATL